MRLTISEPSKDALFPGSEDVANTYRAGTYAASPAEDAFAQNFAGFNVESSVDTRLETKALIRAIINKRYSDVERQTLLAERQVILERQFAGSASRSDLNRFEYINWTLDQIEDARHGEALDRLEASIARYESFLEGVEQLTQDVRRVSMTRRKR